jgi:subtilisin family serine protease
VGPDGGNDTFLGYTLASAGMSVNSSTAACRNNAAYPNFFGTSAATPHVASIAALMLQANPALTPTQIYDALRSTALPMGSPSPNVNSGTGLVQADAAFAALPQVVPAAPSLTLGTSSISVGDSTTLTWSAVNATACTAAGAWSGAVATSGTRTLTPSAAGTDTYSLTCANSAGSSAATSVTLTVEAASTNHGGGGDLDPLALLGLAMLSACRILRSRRVLHSRPRLPVLR